ncbi:hypothetical protein P5673_011843 [Acropora cervicornis]|uniref:Uncharacterized protein n=1 Tax=Acropora cervicornis TaxID=6130 RepID=A0AAD9QNI2_ACRCE|nr:hypothetical protein P5673_011843 [Acropora cervicornis]
MMVLLTSLESSVRLNSTHSLR